MIDKSQTALLELIKSSLFGAEPHFPEDTDWDAVLQEATAQTVVALVSKAVPQPATEKCKVPAAQSTAHYMRALFEQTNLIKLFTDHGIPLVILKGAAAAMYYPKPQLRTMGDVDFLVPEKDFETGKALLTDNGYVFQEAFEDGREYSFYKSGVFFELHHHYSDAEYDIEPILVHGMENAETHTLHGYRFPTLPDYENGLVLLDHIRHHLHGGLGIRQIIDWMMFANAKLSDETYRENFLPLLQKARLVTFCETVTKMCKLYFGLPERITWCDGADAETAKQLLETVMRGGNFGRKDPYVYKPMKELTSGIRKKGLFRVLQEAGVANFAICRKNKFFRCFAWLFQIFRYLGRGIAALFHGENLKKDLREGNETADFYQRLGL